MIKTTKKINKKIQLNSCDFYIKNICGEFGRFTDVGKKHEFNFRLKFHRNCNSLCFFVNKEIYRWNFDFFIVQTETREFSITIQFDQFDFTLYK
jgi:hypothetical protein